MQVWQCDQVISQFITQINIGNRFGKKLEAVNQNTRKVEDIVFELSMLQRGGRSGKKAPSDAPEGAGAADEE